VSDAGPESRRARYGPARSPPHTSPGTGTHGRNTRTQSLGIASHWLFEAWGRFPLEQTTTVSLLHHAVVIVTEGTQKLIFVASVRVSGREAGIYSRLEKRVRGLRRPPVAGKSV
jgi:hypothetical protein